MPNTVHIALHELRLYWKLALGWITAMALLAIVTVATFDSFADQQQQIEALLKSMSPEFLQGLLIDVDNYTSVAGFINGNFMNMFLIAQSLLAAYIGVATIGKEMRNGTLFVTLASPTRRFEVYLAKLVAITIMLIGIAIAVMGITYLFASSTITTASVDGKYFMDITLAAIVFQTLFLVLGVSLSVYMVEGLALGVTAAYAVAAIVINSIAYIQDVPNFVRYLTPYYYINVTRVARGDGLDVGHLLFLIILMFVVTGLGIYRFYRRDVTV